MGCLFSKKDTGQNRRRNKVNGAGAGGKPKAPNTIKPITLGYWQIKGLGEFSRLTLAYLKHPFIEKNPEGFEAWGADAQKLMGEGLQFPNLPYLKHGDFFITESMTIPVYLCRILNRLDLIGGNDIKTEARLNEITGVLGDVRMEVMKALMTPEYKNVLAEGAKEGSKLNRKLQFLSMYLGQNDFFLNNKFTLADIFVAFSLYIVSNLLKSGEADDVVANHQNLVAHQARVFGLPGIKDHISSPAWKRPLFFPTMFPWVKEF